MLLEWLAEQDAEFQVQRIGMCIVETKDGRKYEQLNFESAVLASRTRFAGQTCKIYNEDEGVDIPVRSCDKENRL